MDYLQKTQPDLGCQAREELCNLVRRLTVYYLQVVDPAACSMFRIDCISPRVWPRQCRNRCGRVRCVWSGRIKWGFATGNALPFLISIWHAIAGPYFRERIAGLRIEFRSRNINPRLRPYVMIGMRTLAIIGYIYNCLEEIEKRLSPILGGHKLNIYVPKFIQPTFPAYYYLSDSKR